MPADRYFVFFGESGRVTSTNQGIFVPGPDGVLPDNGVEVTAETACGELSGAALFSAIESQAGWTYADGAFVAPVSAPARNVDLRRFTRLFSPQEFGYLAAHLEARTEKVVYWNGVAQAGGLPIDLDDPITIFGLNELGAIDRLDSPGDKILTPERIARILSNQFPE